MKFSLNAILWNMGLIFLTAFVFYYTRSFWSLIILFLLPVMITSSTDKDNKDQ